MSELYTELRWLVPAPADFPQRLKTIAESKGPLGGELQALAAHALD